MSISVRLPAVMAATHQCTIGAATVPGTGQMQIRIAGTVATGARTANGAGNARSESAQWVVTANVPSGGSVIEFVMAAGTDHLTAMTFLRDFETYARSAPVATDHLSAADVIRGVRVIADYVRQTTLRAP